MSDAKLLANTPMKVTKASENKNQTIYAIKEYILSNDLHPGDPLPTEAQMCTALGISRSSVREAIRTLTALDIVEVRHGHGTFVGKVSMQPMVESLVFRGMLNPGNDHRLLTEIVEVRKALDLSFADQVVQAWQDKRDEKLEIAVANMDALSAKGKAFPEDDRFFHSRLLAPLPNQLFRQLTDAFWDIHTRTVPLLIKTDENSNSKTARAHRAMLQAAYAGDYEAYCSAVNDHYQPIIDSLAAVQNALG